jgi:hypothetical protein
MIEAFHTVAVLIAVLLISVAVAIELDALGILAVARLYRRLYHSGLIYFSYGFLL